MIESELTLLTSLRALEVGVVRIPDAELARLKAEVSVARLVEGCGVELVRQGKDLVGGCPFHQDESPSLVVTPGKNLWHCLGACQVGGGPIDWVMTAQGVSFRHAVELLRESSPSLGVLAEPTMPGRGSGGEVDGRRSCRRWWPRTRRTPSWWPWWWATTPRPWRAIPRRRGSWRGGRIDHPEAVAEVRGRGG